MIPNEDGKRWKKYGRSGKYMTDLSGYLHR